MWYNKRGERDEGEWLIAAPTQTIPYLPIVTTQHKTRRARIKDG